jgi:hypothetical protein
MDIRPFTGKRRLLTPPLIDADPANFHPSRPYQWPTFFANSFFHRL